MLLWAHDVRAFDVPPRLGRFDGQLTSAHLPHIDLLCAQEILPRIAYFSLPSSSLFMTFLMRSGAALLLNGGLARISASILSLRWFRMVGAPPSLQGIIFCTTNRRRLRWPAEFCGFMAVG
jgi:hypothetical protein